MQRAPPVNRGTSGRSFYAGLLEALTQVMGSAKGYLVEHGSRVAMLALQIADSLGLSEREKSQLLFASVLSDMGMVGLAEEAWENPVSVLHPVRSEECVAHMPHLEDLAPLVRHHHEWWDGSGYPDGLSGQEIPIGARILRLADTVVALGQLRPHRQALSQVAIEDVARAATGIEFAPEVARAYLGLCHAGDLASFDRAAFRHAVGRATAHLLPAEVSPLSSDHLLTILANLIDAKDPYTGGHSRRVASLGVAVAERLGLQDHMKATLWAGGYLHDLGKLRVPLRILVKGGPLTDAEFRLVRAHPSDGAAILEGIPSLRHLTSGVRYHHERWDGRGYPEGLRADHIPLVGQVLAVCDSYDAMTSRRAYRDSRSHEEALDEVRRSSGVHFGPRVVEAFVDLPSEVFVTPAEPLRSRVPLFRGSAFGRRVPLGLPVDPRIARGR